MTRGLAALLVALIVPAHAVVAQDPGKETIGTVKTELLFVTSGEIAELGPGATALTSAEEKRLRASKHIPKFKHCRRLGSDLQPILRGYKNWAAPMSKSKAIMVTFQPQGTVNQKLRMDLELWQNEKMVLRADPTLDEGEEVFILGPKWRGGRLIITVELVSLKKP